MNTDAPTADEQAAQALFDQADAVIAELDKLAPRGAGEVAA
jgi:hypothetical protein